MERHDLATLILTLHEARKLRSQNAQSNVTIYVRFMMVWATSILRDTDPFHLPTMKVCSAETQNARRGRGDGFFTPKRAELRARLSGSRGCRR
jgi:hypothetical protein